jgi:phage/plasmid-associated DNA primase
LCPVSRERNTGKSTFLDLLRYIFKENMTILDNERFAGKFTSHYIDKLLIAVDETFIDVEKPVIKERIKNLCIGKRQWLEAKGKNAQEIEVYSKLILCSNSETNFLQIDEGENRFAVIKVPVLSEDDPGLLEKMKKEVPQFLQFLAGRELRYEIGVSRFSFDPRVYQTQLMMDVVSRTKNRVEKAITEFIKDCFLQFKMEELFFAPKDIAEEINKNVQYKIDENKIKDFLKYDRGLNPIGPKRYKLYGVFDRGTDSLSVEEVESKVGRPYRFYFKDWLTNQEIEEEYFETIVTNVTTTDNEPF